VDGSHVPKELIGKQLFADQSQLLLDLVSSILLLFQFTFILLLQLIVFLLQFLFGFGEWQSDFHLFRLTSAVVVDLRFHLAVWR
jgi:hypothetical protein